MRQLNFQNDDKQRRPRRSRQLVSTGVLCRKASSSICLMRKSATSAREMNPPVRRWADDLDEIAVRLERKSRYAEKGLLIEHETGR